MAGFPKLIPAFTARVAIEPAIVAGSIASAGMLAHATIIPEITTLVSEPGYSIALDAKLVHGADYITMDPDARHARLDVDSLVKDGPTGGVIRFCYTGVVDLTGPCGKVLRGEPDSATTDFGGAFTSVVFQTGSKEHEAMQHKVYVGSGRFVLEAGKPAIVEYKISEVTA